MSKIDEYSNLLYSYNHFRKKLIKSRLLVFNDLLDNFKKLKKFLIEKYGTEPPYFNPFYLLNITYDELTHSNILAWLFDPYGTHNQGDLFFRNFVSFNKFNVFYDNWKYKVKREYSGNESVIDILIYGRNFIFYIEYKVLSPEGHDQTNRECRDLRRLAKVLNIKENIHPIFLTPKGQKAKNITWIPLSYSSLAQSIEISLKEVKSDYVKQFVQSWINILKNLGGKHEL